MNFGAQGCRFCFACTGVACSHDQHATAGKCILLFSRLSHSHFLGQDFDSQSLLSTTSSASLLQHQAVVNAAPRTAAP
jgi:hypothetical protein